ncbi:MAG: tRNA pseudouridine(38-40) synthase TruA [Candidatus Aminicenantaceae bacterium]
MIENYKLFISYDGTDFHGWQRQPKKRTIQGLIEETLAKITQKKITLIGAGRTDAGVHAQGQVANFTAAISLKEEELLRAANSLLPDDINVFKIVKTDLNFHARKMAKSKVYKYRIFNSPDISPFIHRYVLHWPSPLKVELMKKAALFFEREADFTAFSSNRLLHPVRKVFVSKIEKKGKEISYTIEANGFLRYMVRTIMGTLLEIGRGKLQPEVIEKIFFEKRRSLAGATAPAKGLCLMKVRYR